MIYIHRLDGVESRLQETSAEFEATRALAKRPDLILKLLKSKGIYVCYYTYIHACICSILHGWNTKGV